MRHKGAAGNGHDALPLKSTAQPVADFALAIQQVELVGSDNAAELSLTPDTCREALIRCELLQGGSDKAERVVPSLGRVHPWEPFPQIGAIPIHQREHL